MKQKFLLSLLVLFAFVGNMSAQCAIDSTLSAPFDPLPLSSLSPGDIGVAYNDKVSVYLPDSLTFNAADFGIPLPIPIPKLAVQSCTFTLSGMPAGMTATCSPTCTFEALDFGSFCLSGTPTSGGAFTLTASAVYTVIIDAATAALDDIIGGPLEPGPFTLPAGIPYTWDGEVATSVEEDLDPNAFQLSQNVPNPTSGLTKVYFTSPNPAQVSFEVFNIVGGSVHTEIVNANTGLNNIEFDASNLQAGVYFYAVTKGDVSLNKRMLIVK